MNYYKVLEVDREASPEVIQKAYKALSMKYHPDRQVSAAGPAAHAKMSAINEAYAVLSDPRRRDAYDDQTIYWRVWIDDGLIGVAKAWLLQK